MKRFRERLDEGELVYSGEGFRIFSTKHSTDRIGTRNRLSGEEFQEFFSRIAHRLEKLKGYAKEISDHILFYSQSLQQGVVTAWDKAKNTLRIITFLPRNRHFAKPGTDEVVVEGLGSIHYEEVD
jgi:hypothetical protein